MTGNQTSKATSRRRLVKGLAVATVGLFACIILLAFVLLKIKIQSRSDSSTTAEESTGSTNLTGLGVHMIRVPFNTARLEIQSSLDGVFHWNCKTEGERSLETEIKSDVLTLNLDRLTAAKCKIFLPLGIASEFKGVNGHMELNSPRDPIAISLTNGKVNIRPDQKRIYDFDVEVKNGLHDFFPPSDKHDAIAIKVQVQNGLVNRK